MEQQIEVGDWVQAKIDMNDTLPDGTNAMVAKVGAVGHVMGVDCWDGIVAYIVTWERTNASYTCFPEELLVLCDFQGEK